MKDMLICIDKAKTYRKRGKGYHKNYKDIIITFDIETTALENDNAIMYIWQLAYESKDGVKAITGRTWEEFEEVVYDINNTLGPHERVIIWVHNLQYEFSFLKGILKFDDVFAIRTRRVLYAVCGGIEFRCTYLLTNMSLDRFLQQMDVEHKKLTLDYNKKRYPWTDLTPNEYAYCINDVIGLAEAMRRRLELDNDNVATVPYTSTGYIRRDAKRAYAKISYGYRREILPDYGPYRLLRLAFRGGNCHANRWITGHIIEDVKSYDRASSYPDVMLTCEYPASQFYHLGPVTLKEFNRLYNIPKAIIMEVRLTELDLKDIFYPIPYLARFKCREVGKILLDNGRIIKADTLVTVINDIDYKILSQQYNFKMEILDLYYARYGKISGNITDLIIRDYQNKTSFKGKDPYYYARSKERVNAYYGMFAQDPVRDNLLYIGGEEVFRPEGLGPIELLERYNKKGFLPYQVGCWVTSWARYRLEQGIRIVHDNGGMVCYVDTDSVKYKDHNAAIEKGFEEFNKKAAFCSREAGLVGIDDNGKEYPAGIYEYEGSYRRFKTLGAKKYVYEDDSGLHITIAGVNKKTGAAELGKIENFKNGFTFREAGGLESVYNDGVDFEMEIDGHLVRIRDNVCLKQSTYTIGQTKDYMQLLTALSNEIYFNDLL